MQVLKNKICLIIVFMLSSVGSVKTSAQSTNYFNFQAVISDASGKPVEGNVAIRVSILQYSKDGESVYIERHVEDADKNGFVSLRIGESSDIYKGEFDTIQWNEGPYFLKIDIDPEAGYSYPISSITELLSVPYARYAAFADSVAEDYREEDPEFIKSVAFNITEEDTARWNALSEKSRFKIGDFYQGGIIFYLNTEGKHGLIVLPYDLSENILWSESLLQVNSLSTFDGKENTLNIISALGAGNLAAYACDTLSAGNYDDWYLPSVDELNLVFQKRYLLNKILDSDGDENTTALTNGGYWSSTENDSGTAYILKWGAISVENKGEYLSLRPIRSF